MCNEQTNFLTKTNLICASIKRELFVSLSNTPGKEKFQSTCVMYARSSVGTYVDRVILETRYNRGTIRYRKTQGPINHRGGIPLEVCQNFIFSQRRTKVGDLIKFRRKPWQIQSTNKGVLRENEKLIKTKRSEDSF